jgi:hypothetical protein
MVELPSIVVEQDRFLKKKWKARKKIIRQKSETADRKVKRLTVS